MDADTIIKLIKKGEFNDEIKPSKSFDILFRDDNNDTCATAYIVKYATLPPKWMQYKIFLEGKEIFRTGDPEAELCNFCKVMKNESKEYKGMVRTKNYVFRLYECGDITFSPVLKEDRWTHPFELMRYGGGKKNIGKEFLTMMELSKRDKLTNKDVVSALNMINSKAPKHLVEEFIKDRDPVKFSNKLNSR